MKAFLSYSSLDKELAGQIKRALEDYGLSVFLAHEDIKPTAEWVNTIRNELRECDIFMPILTENFNDSDWTDQETGIAFILDKKIIPLKFTVDPHGFISHLQAFKMDTGKIMSPLFHKLADVIASDPIIGDRFRDIVIGKFGNSMSWDDATHNAELLSSLGGYSLSQFSDIIRYTKENHEIWESFKAQKVLRSFFYKYRNAIDPKLLQELPQTIRPNLGS